MTRLRHFLFPFRDSAVTIRRMSKGQREPEPSSVQLTSRRRRGVVAHGGTGGEKSAFMNAFVDALRDILRDERRRAA
jgi:hypothetical protein